MQTNRIILHIDMNCFYASCEIAVDETLKGKPVVIAHSDPFQRSIILSPSYEARKYGIKATMKIKEAFDLCHDIVVVEPDHKLYEHYSKLFYDYLLKITPLVEMASIDEAYVDCTYICQGAEVVDLAQKIQKDIYEMYKLPTSIGIAPNKLLAKIASDMKKPMGITVLRRREIDKYMWPLPISDLLGVGKKTVLKMEELNIKTIGDLANYQDLEKLKRVFGQVNALNLYSKANGIDDSVVNPEEVQSTSVSNEHTFYLDTFDKTLIKNTIKALCNTMGYRLQSGNQKAYTIGVKFKYGNMKMYNRSKALTKPINDEYELFKNCLDIFDDHYEEDLGIRLIGVFANRLVEDSKTMEQISIFDDFTKIEKEEAINKLLKSVNVTFGKDTVKKGIK